MVALSEKKSEVEAEQGASRAQMQELALAKELLLSQVHSLETQITTLNNIIQQAKNQENQLRERLDKLMVREKRGNVKKGGGGEAKTDERSRLL